MHIPKAVLFDLDDTLTGRDEAFHAFAEKFIDRFVGKTDDDKREKMIDTLAALDNHGYRKKSEVFESFFDTFAISNRPSYKEMEEFWVSRFPEGVRPLPGVAEMLRFLKNKGLKLGVVTNGFSPILQNSKIDHAEIRDYFDLIVVSKEIGIEKPDRGIFDYAIDQLSLKADACIFVGDHLINDIYGSKNAGMTAVWYNPGRLKNDSDVQPDYEINDYAALIKLIFVGSDN